MLEDSMIGRLNHVAIAVPRYCGGVQRSIGTRSAPRYRRPRRCPSTA